MQSKFFDRRFDCTQCPYRMSCIDNGYSDGCRYYAEKVQQAVRKRRFSFRYAWKHAKKS